MKLAFSRGGIWFFTTILLVVFLIGGKLDEGSIYVNILLLVGFGALFGGLGFFITWNNCVKEERQLELEERRNAISDYGSGCE